MASVKKTLNLTLLLNIKNMKKNTLFLKNTTSLKNHFHDFSCKDHNILFLE